uniref:Glutamate-1-semialdehyde 2,1-aminomutase n=1 Tax=Aplanochytrium stocchinoi TaxID=215587 RepID=A0A6S8B488_9STRA|mmetsp:Transcript_8452/g.11045  ORF Transcript_8452/g.11045 Transcript_8452/m.11045 type:complete len:429 (-) Transcript_8452:601-1887(-)|eukprot:CAMPEP_0204826770 /NCGR_PEP_ID=MMETSP1346-20131115/4396_1 /ASSEMBLY_ACC=CAM_ASM_000771 /TAXON_ID=215587 /ORGANISM="Aplanochytrium stocchinoi, Strain GSBS06" /LENGTH=428 /DNA_ID=CAMNT_0051954935 /DNA_START=431 /DNA_END=1717 /DNA_ORIENTATION=+
MKNESKEENLKERSKKVLVSLTHLSIAGLPKGYTQFFDRGEGCYIYDVDGKRYIDFMASFGPILLGHQHEGVDSQVRKQMLKGNCLAGPSEKMVELAELLSRVIPYAEWAYFAKNGTDSTTIAVRMARAHTGKRVILRAPSSYHGSAEIWKEGSNRRLLREGVLPEQRAYLSPYVFNDVKSVSDAVEAAGDDFAGIICPSFKWDYGFDQELPTIEFLTYLRRVCDENNAVLICDDVRSSMRLSLAGSWAYLEGCNVEPDLSCLCKGIANGYEMSAVVGNNRLRKAAGTINATGSFWCNAIPFTAAIHTIETLAQNPSIHENMKLLGEKLRSGLNKVAKGCGVEGFRQSGPVQMPYFSFDQERTKPISDRVLIQTFCSYCARLGVWFHPYHTMFLTAAHTDADIESTLSVAEVAFRAVKSLQRDHIASL